MLCSMGEHVFDKDSVSPRGVIYKDVGDGTDNFPVLEDRGTAHALDDSTGFFKQSFIRYLDFDSAVDVVVIQVKGFDFDRIELRRSVLLQAAQDLCFSFFYFLFQSNRQCFALYFVRFFLAQGAEDSFDRIYGPVSCIRSDDFCLLHYFYLSLVFRIIF